MKGTNILLLIALTLCWGPSFFFIKIGLTELPVLSIVSIRLLVGGLLLFLLIQAQKKHFFKWLYLWKHFFVMSISTNILPFCLITYAEITTSSSLAGIINASQPIFTVILAHYFIDTEKFTLKTLIGISIGLSGIVLIFLPSLFDIHSDTLGILYLSIASVCSASAIVYAKKFLSHLPNLVAPAYQLLIGAVLTLPIAFFFEKPHLLALPSLGVIFSLLALSIFGTAIAFVIYYYLVRHAGATYLSTASILLPFISIFLGVLILHETLYWTAYIGCSLILIGLIITNSLISLRGLKTFLSILFKVKKP